MTINKIKRTDVRSINQDRQRKDTIIEHKRNENITKDVEESNNG